MCKNTKQNRQRIVKVEVIQDKDIFLGENFGLPSCKLIQGLFIVEVHLPYPWFTLTPR